MPGKRNYKEHRSLDLTSARLFYRELDVVPEMTEQEEQEIHTKQESLRFLMLKAILCLPFGRRRMTEHLYRLAKGRKVREFIIDRNHWGIQKGILRKENRKILLELIPCLQVRYPRRSAVRELCLNWARVEAVGRDVFAGVDICTQLLVRRRKLLSKLDGDISSSVEDAISYEYSDIERQYDSWEKYPELISIENQLDLIEIRMGVSITEYIHQEKVFDDAVRQFAETLERYVEGNLRLVLAQVRHYHISDALEEMDLVQEGCYGLLEAARRFDINRGFRFSTYAVWWIKQAILRILAKQTRLIHLPAYVIAENRIIKNAVDSFQNEYSRTPDIEELAGYMEMETEQIVSICLATSPTLSLDCSSGIENTVLADFLEGSLMSHAGSVLQDDLRSRLDEVLESLSDREKTIISLRYGLSNDDPCTLRDLARVFKISRERIRQIEERALSKLREHGIFGNSKENGN